MLFLPFNPSASVSFEVKSNKYLFVQFLISISSYYISCFSSFLSFQPSTNIFSSSSLFGKMSTTATPFGQMAHGTSSLFDADGGTSGLFGAKAQSGNKLFLVQSM